VGDPYEIAGVWYYPREDPEYDETGIGSWYGEQFHGRLTANGETFDRNAISAAHPTLPMPVNARVTNLENGRSLVVRINDRGPFVNDRIIDLSERAAELLGYRIQGTARVRVIFLGRAELNGSRTLSIGESTPPEIANAVPAVPTSFVATSALSPVAGATIAASRPVEVLPRASPQLARQVSSLPGVDGEVIQLTDPPPMDRGVVQVTDPPSVDGAEIHMPDPSQNEIYVQAGTFNNFLNADRVASSLAHAGAQISRVDRGQNIIFRVRMGPYQDVATADAVLYQIQTAGHADVNIVIE
jgi:rare lipoprotein A